MEYQYELPFDLVIPTTEVEWTDEMIDWLHIRILKKNLIKLKDGRASHKTKSEILDWFMSDVICPFSYAACCYADGSEPELFRMMVLENIKK